MQRLLAVVVALIAMQFHPALGAEKAPAKPMEKIAKKNTPLICSLKEGKPFQFDPGLLSKSDEQDWVGKIVGGSGLARNFDVFTAPIENAVAFVESGKRFVVYDPELFAALENKTHNHWVGISIMAHEIGHHLNGHTVMFEGSQQDLELEADSFSGFILYKLGASIDDARAAMKTLASEEGSETHPGRAKRLAAITRGWNNACAKDDKCIPEADDDEGVLENQTPLFGSGSSSKDQDAFR